MSALPELFTDRLKNIIPRGYFDSVIRSFDLKRAVCIRINTLKTSEEKVIYFLRNQKISFKRISWYHDALLLEGISSRDVTQTYLFENGCIYIQSLSSMLAPLILDPKPGEHILDMCAAPGGKTTQMAAMMQNKGSILALEAVKPRYYKLRSVISLLGGDIIKAKLTDARRFSYGVNPFDRILIDAPCSCEGRFRSFDKKSQGYWSLRKIKEMSHKQKGLLLNAIRLLKIGGMLLYATCTFAPEENEVVIDWLLNKTNNTLRIIKPDAYPIFTCPAVLEWNNKKLNPQVENCLRVLPNETMEGFFITKLMKTG